MNKRTRFPQEVRERAVRMVFEHTEEHGGQWEAIQSIAVKLGMSPETLRRWFRQAELDRRDRR
ncbi:MAG: transposase [Proteobacteria bacterium]|nr:transposase [Pseudomonadota bacterium]